MKSLALLLCLLTSACTTARVTQPWPEVGAPPVQSNSSSSPARAVHRMALGRLPRFQLREMALGKMPNADVVLNGNLDQTYTLGWINNGYPATGTNMLQYVFGDRGSGCQAGNGDKMECWAYHGVVIEGGRASTSAPAARTGSGSSDPSLEVIGAGGLRISTSTKTGTGITFSGRGAYVTPSSSPPAVAANTCSSVATITISGAATGADCIVGTTNILNLVPICRVSTTDTVQAIFCNITAASITLPVSTTWNYRVFNP